jgi:Porin subfamily
LRSEAAWGNTNGSLTNGPFTGQADNRNTSNFVTRSRGYITLDVREQTAFGTARAYLDVGFAPNQGGFGVGYNAFSSNRAFIQWAGITAGLTQSFYDFYNNAATAYRTYWFSSDTGDGGQWVWGYTWQMGNGLSATIAAEDRRMTEIVGAGPFGTDVAGNVITAPVVAASNGCGTGQACSGIASIGTATVAQLGYGGYQSPDVVGNVRIDQTWGSAQVMAAAHELNPEYFNPTLDGIPGGRWTGHPGNTWGWAVGAGLRWNFPTLAPGDYLQTQVNYTQGALRYMWGGPTPNNWIRETSNEGTFGVFSDCVFASVTGNANTGATTSCDKTTGWNVNAAFEHYWTPALHESFVGQYGQVRYDDAANNTLCGLESNTSGLTSINGGPQARLVNGLPVALPGCNNNFNLWGMSSRLQWDVTKSFYLGVEIVYEHLDSATSATGTLPAGITMGTTSPANRFVTVGGNAENVWVGTVRVHKDFLP